MQNQYSFLFKYIIIGDASVGKSCILMQFLQNRFKIDSETTVGVEFGSKTIEIENQKIRLQIWDTGKRHSNRQPGHIIEVQQELYQYMIQLASNPSLIFPNGLTKPKVMQIRSYQSFWWEIKQIYSTKESYQLNRVDNLLRETKCFSLNVLPKMIPAKFFMIWLLRYLEKQKNESLIPEMRLQVLKQAHTDQGDQWLNKEILFVVDHTNFNVLFVNEQQLELRININLIYIIMGNSSASQTATSLEEIFNDIDPQLLNKKGQEVYKFYYDKVQFPQISIFNQYRLSPYVKKFSIDKTQKKQIREMLDQINIKSQSMFEKKWESLNSPPSSPTS